MARWPRGETTRKQRNLMWGQLVALHRASCRGSSAGTPRGRELEEQTGFQAKCFLFLLPQRMGSHTFPLLLCCPGLRTNLEGWLGSSSQGRWTQMTCAPRIQPGLGGRVPNGKSHQPPEFRVGWGPETDMFLVVRITPPKDDPTEPSEVLQLSGAGWQECNIQALSNFRRHQC